MNTARSTPPSIPPHISQQPSRPTPMFFQQPTTPFLPLQAFIQQHHASVPWHAQQTSQGLSYHSQAQNLVPPQQSHETLHGRQISFTSGDSASVSTIDSLPTPKLDIACSSSPTVPTEAVKGDGSWAGTWTGDAWTSTNSATDGRQSQSPTKLPDSHTAGPASSGPIRSTRRQIPAKSKSTSVVPSQQPVRKGTKKPGAARVPESAGQDRRGSIKPPSRPISVQPHVRPESKDTTSPPAPVELSKVSSWPFALHGLRPSVPVSTALAVPAPSEDRDDTRVTRTSWTTPVLAGPGPIPTAVPGPAAPAPPAQNQDAGIANAVQALFELTVDLRNMSGGTYDEWSNFVADTFQPGARFNLSLPSSSGLGLYDIDSAYLPQLFTSAGLRSTKLEITSLGAPLSEDSTSTATAECFTLHPWADWTWVYKNRTTVWKCRLVVNMNRHRDPGERLQISRLDVKVDSWDELGETKAEGGLPDRALRVLELAEQMENMEGVVALAQTQSISPHDIMKRIQKFGASQRFITRPI